MASSVIAGQITSNCFYLLQTFEKTWCAVLPHQWDQWKFGVRAFAHEWE